MKTKETIGRLLYRLFEKTLNSLVFEEEKIHGNYFDKCEVYYIDTSGYKYYMPKNLFDLPNKRNQYLQGLLKKLEMGFNSRDYNAFLEAFEKEIENIISAHKDEGKIKGMVKIMNYVNELKERVVIQLEPTLLLEMMAVILIREDEQIDEIDHKVIDIKVQQFERDDKLRDGGFFFNSGLRELIDFSENLQESWTEYMDLVVPEMKLRTQILNTLIKR